jgi:hypothetical protein
LLELGCNWSNLHGADLEEQEHWYDVTMGNSQNETASQVGDIPGTIWDKTGTTVASAKIQGAL